jgi:predicted protein tyrosine phosphatase
MEICIKGHININGLLKAKYRQYNVILFTNHTCEPSQYIKTHAKKFLHLAVNDVDDPRDEYGPRINHVEMILDWVKANICDKLICCCYMGVSRSSATAYIVGSSLWGPTQALSLLTPRRHWPNRLIVYLGSLVLQNCNIWTTFVEWQKKIGLDPSENGAWPLKKLFNML